MILKNNYNKINGYILLKGGRIYDSYINLNTVSDILIENGTIIKIKKNISAKSHYHIIDCKKKIITNGFTDLHAHFREPGYEFKETIKSGADSAFYGGYTRVCTMPNTNPVIDNPELIQFVIKQSQNTPIYIHPIGSITKGQKGIELSEIGEMVSKGAIAISDDGLPVSNAQILRIALEYAKMYDIPVINHAEDISLINNGLIHEGSSSLRLGLPGNPGISESSMVYRDISIARYVDGKLHIPHVSSKESLEVIKDFKSKGIHVTAEVTPHHLCLNDDILLDYNTNAKVSPPIRSKENQQALLNAVKDGTIDCIATDHAPHAIENKEKDFVNASCGMIGLESAFGLVNKTLSNADIPLESIIKLFTINPSQIFNIFPSVIKEGNLAELNIIDPDLEWVFKEENIRSKSHNTPIIDMKLKGKVLITINKGFISNRKLS